MKPLAFSLLAPYLCKTPSLWLCVCSSGGGVHPSLPPPPSSLLRLPPFSTLLSCLFTLFTSLLSPSPHLPVLYSSLFLSPAVLALSKSCLLPPLLFIPSLKTGFLQGKNSAAHFVSLSASIYAPLLPSLFFSLSLSLLFTIQ